MRVFGRATAFVSLLWLVMVLPLAAGMMQEYLVSFPKGRDTAVIRGTVRGDMSIDYLLHAESGQRVRISMHTDNRSAYFNLYEPGKLPGDQAFFIGSTVGDTFEGTLPATGDYTVDVYLMRSAARRKRTAHYSLTITLTNPSKADLGTPPASDIKVKGTPYHAVGKVPCSTGATAPGTPQCDFRVIRGSAGNVEVHLTSPDGHERVVSFLGGAVSIASDGKVTASKSDDTWSVVIDDDEHYQIPEALISGG